MATASELMFPQMDWASTDHCEAFSLFKQKMTLYLDDEEITDDDAKARKICRGLGDEGLKRLNASGLTEGEKKKTKELWTFFENQLKTNVNFRIHRLQLMQYRQNADETLDDFVTRARTLAHKCEFEPEQLSERIIELIIASTPYDAFRKELLGKAKGTPIKDILVEGRKHEALAVGKEQLTQLSNSSKPVDYFRKHPQGHSKGKKCTRCDTVHQRGRCPAYNSICDRCNNWGHWKSACKTVLDNSKPRGRQPRRDTTTNQRRPNCRKSKQRMDDIYCSDNDNEVCDTNVCFDAITKRREQVFTVLKCQPPTLPTRNYSIKLKVDTGASGSTLPVRTFKQMYGENYSVLTNCNDVNLIAYNGGEIKCIGKITMPVSVDGNSWQQVQFYVVDVPGPPVIGLTESENLGLVTINVDIFRKKSSDKSHVKTVTFKDQPKSVSNNKINSADDLQKLFPDQFDKIGKFPGVAKLHLKENYEPHVAAPRKCSIHMREKIKSELDRMEDLGIIRKVTEHTDWCSNLVFAEKKDKSIRVCLDPQKLN